MVEVYLGCIQFWVTMNKSNINIHVQICICAWIKVFISLGQRPKGEASGSQMKHKLNCMKYCRPFPQRLINEFTFSPAARAVGSPRTLFVPDITWAHSRCVCVGGYPHCGLNTCLSSEWWCYTSLQVLISLLSKVEMPSLTSLCHERSLDSGH